MTSATQDQARSARREAGGPRRRELLGVAGRCFAELGYEATTIDVIATRAEVSRATFYAYFSSKEAVFQAVAEAICRQFLDAQLVEDVDAAEPCQVIRATTRAFIEVIFSNGGLVALIEHRARVDERIGELWSRVQGRTRRRFTTFLDRLDGAGLVEPCVAPRQIVESTSDALLLGASRLSAAGADEREQFITDHIAIIERLIGLS